MPDVDILVIGAGPAGLGAGVRLAEETGVEWLLCEALPKVGGLSRSIVDEAGYTWDLGGHVCFSHYDYVTRILKAATGPEGWYDHRREAWIRLADSWIPYPFQNNLHRLPADLRDRCLRGLLEAAAGESGEPRDFGEFIDARFGRGVAELFMRPYNEKVWAYPLDTLSYGWIGERVSVPDVHTVLENVERGTDDVEWGPNATFMFPKAGGTGAFWSGIARSLPAGRVRTGAEVVGLDARDKRAHFADGSVLSYRNLITTAPLDVTARLMRDERLTQLTSRLRHSSVTVIGLGTEAAAGERLGSRCWVYFPERGVPPYRVTNFSHYSPAHVPAGSGKASLLVEVSESPHRPLVDDLVPRVIAGLVETGLLADAAEVSHTWTHRVEHAYPTPTLDRDEVVEPALAYLEELDILSRGRFGAWRYEVGNMDHSFAQGHEAATRILTGAAEVTVNDPRTANG
jgi:protoporphyrinogen oxidase